MNGGTSTLSLSFLGISIPMGWTFGVFILFLLVGTTNAVNLTDGIDGLASSVTLVVSCGFMMAAGFLNIPSINVNYPILSTYSDI